MNWTVVVVVVEQARGGRGRQNRKQNVFCTYINYYMHIE